MNAALLAGRREAGHVADHATAKGDERAIAVAVKVQQGGKHVAQNFQRLVLLAVRQNDRFVAQPGQRGASAVEIKRGDGGITDHQHMPTGNMRAQQVGAIQQAWTCLLYTSRCV